MGNRKAQMSIEILVVVSFIIILSTGVIVGINTKNQKIEQLRESLEAKKQAEKLAATISNALYNGDGYTVNITVSKFVGSAQIQTFVVRPSGRYIEIDWVNPTGQNSSITVPMSTKNVDGTLTITKNILNIANSKNVITITEYVG